MKVAVILCLCVVSVLSHNLDPKQKEIRKKLESVEILPSKGYPWPLPQEFLKNPTYFSLDPLNFKFLLSKECEILINAVKRYKDLVFLDKCAKSTNTQKKSHPKDNMKLDPNYLGKLYNISIEISGSCESWPYMDMDEQYLLQVNSPDRPNQILLFSSSVWGALRGLETFSHLVYDTPFKKFLINTTAILDFPRFPHRGVLLDTSRHFIPVSTLLENLDGMAQVKMNVFHWHIVDDQSFPYVSMAFPDLSGKGAFNPETHIYSPEDVSKVVQYARERGIRVVPEFDTPGHTLSWGKSQQGLLTPCYSKSVPDGTYGPIDPTNATNYIFLKSFFKEISTMFPDNYVHLGGDEVSFECWKSNPFVNEFMKKQGFAGNYAKLEEYYMTRLVQIVESLSKSYFVWQEVLDNEVKIKNDTVIHVWKDPHEPELTKVTSAGYNAILSSCWYLNYISYGTDWPTYYACDPYNFNGTQAQKRLVIGGEVCMWGEYVDGNNVISRTWPRAAAVAERLWSDQSVTDVNAAAPRLEEIRCRMMKRGLSAQPANGPGFCDCDYVV